MDIRLLSLVILFTTLAEAEPPTYRNVSAPWHSSQILALVASGDGQKFAALDLESRLGVWSLGQTTPLLLLDNSQGEQLALNQDGSSLAIIKGSQSVEIFDVPSGRSRAQLDGHTGKVMGMAFSPDGTRFATISKDKSFRVWNTEDWKLLVEQELEEEGAALAFSPDGNELAVATGWEFGTLHLWDLKSGRQKQQLSLDRPDQKATPSSYVLPPRVLSFSPDGKKLVSGNFGGVDIWDLSSNLLVGRMAIESRGGPGVSALSAGPESIRVWDGAAVRELTYDAKQLSSSETTNSAAKLALLKSGWVEGRVSGQLVAGGLDREWRVGYPDSSAESICFLANGRLLAGYNDGTLLTLDPSSGKTLRSLQTQSRGIQGLTVIPGEKVVLYGEKSGKLVLRSLPELEVVAEMKGHTAPVTCLDVSNDGRYAVSGSANGEVLIGGGKTRKQLGGLTGHSDTVRALHISPDGRHLVSTAEDATVRIWDLTEKTEVGRLERPGVKTPYTVARFSPDGGLVITAEAYLRETPLNVWDFRERRLLHSVDAGTVKSVVFAQTDQLIAANLEGEIQMVDPVAGRVVSKLGKTTGYGWELARTPDGRYLALATAGQETAIRFWVLSRLRSW